VGNYAATMGIKAQMDELLERHRIMEMSIEAANTKTELMEYLLGLSTLSTRSYIRNLC